MSKGFDASAPIGTVAPASRIGHPAAGRIQLNVNGVQRQRGDLADRIRPAAEIIAALSHMAAIAPGDLFFTGTPEAVGELRPGDMLEGFIEGVGEVVTRISSV